MSTSDSNQNKNKKNNNKKNVKKIFKTSFFISAITLKWLFIIIMIGGFLVGGAAFGYATSLVKDEPIRSKEEIIEKINDISVTGYIYFNDDTLIGEISTNEDRQLISLSEIPDKVIDAFLAVEDKNFREHPGIDIRGFSRAVRQQLLNEAVQTGGSTITQQVAKITFFSFERSNSRKAKEIMLALRMERFLSKDQILEAYLNKIPFGSGSNGYNVHGIKTAAKGIFDIEDLNRLNSAQAAYLAGLPQSPSRYSAFRGNGSFDEEGFKLAINRQHIVLRRMLEENVLTQAEYDQAKAFDIKSSLAPTREKSYTTYPFLMMEAERRAAEQLIKLTHPQLTAQDFRSGEYADLTNEAREELRNGYKVYTTIDQEIYDAMQEIAQNEENFTPDHEEKGKEQVGAIMLDNQTSAILGMIEGRDFYHEQLNHATQMIRQPGSAFKPIAAYLPAIDSGDLQPASIVDDVPIILPDGGRGYHLPVNVNQRYHGLLTARAAFNDSWNIPALRLYNEVVTIEKALDFSKQLGITSLTESDYHARTGVLGGLDYGTTVEELTNAFTSIANHGVFNDAYMIRRIEDSHGNVIYEYKPEPVSVFSEETAYLMTDMMRTVITQGTGRSIISSFNNYNNVPVVGKTGTTQRDHDIWFLGYSPDVSVGVWIGYGQPSSLLMNQGANRRARNIWSMVMDQAYELKPELFQTPQFERPDNIVSMTVSNVSGKLPSQLTRDANRLVTDIFNRQYIPEEEDDSLVRMKVVNYNNVNYIPLASTPEDMLREAVLVKREIDIYALLDEIEEILANMSPANRPKNSRGQTRSIRDYYPQDMHITAPNDPDPRVDDGAPPAPPTNVQLTSTSESEVRITFDFSSSPDVVGYRLYRSFDGRPFVHTPARNVLVGDEAVINDGISARYDHAYYLTAVDVAGNESTASPVVSTGGSYDGFIPNLPNEDIDEQINDNEDEGRPGDGNEGRPGHENDNQDNSNNSGAPSTPSDVEIKLELGLLLAQITWSANPQSENISRYYIYYSAERDGDYQRIGQSNTTRFDYINDTLEGWYRIEAENNNGVSSPSEPIQLN